MNPFKKNDMKGKFVYRLLRTKKIVRRTARTSLTCGFLLNNVLGTCVAQGRS